MLAVINAKLLTVSSGQVENGTVVMDGGTIVGVGSGADVPPGAEVIDARGRIVTPGLVDAHSHAGLIESGVGPEGSDADEAGDPVTAWVRAIDGLNPADTAFDELIRSGVTTVNVLPGNRNVIGGSGVAVKCHGAVVDEMVIRNPTCIKAVLGEEPKNTYGPRGRTPQTRMGSAAVLRNTLLGVRRYMVDHSGNDPNMEALVPVLEGRIPLVISCRRADDMVTAVRICREIGIEPVLVHAAHAHRIAGLLRESGARLAVGPLLGAGLATAVALGGEEIPFCAVSDHPTSNGRYLALAAGLAVGQGLDPGLALSALTLRAAEHVGIEDRVGSIDVGKDADLVVWSGDPLEAMSFADCTIVDGRVVFCREGAFG